MNEQEADVLVAGRDDADDEKPKRGWFGRGRKKQHDDDDAAEHEIEFMTPFGKLELELEPTAKKQERDRKKREKAERQAAKAEAEAARRAEQEAAHARAGTRAQEVVVKGGGGMGKLLVILAVFGLIAAAAGVAVWLFAREPAELERVPPEYRAVELADEPEPQGLMAKVRHRLRRALREGQRASRDAQIEQQQRYEGLTRGT
ncbi:MAG: hypothetical protein IVW36_05065 [Dehalococcoidia bacterium]|nr:hypothetical protein [Dehalococcoidia bacterium]